MLEIPIVQRKPTVVDSRDKGKRLELDAAALLRGIGFTGAERCQQFQGLGSDGDIRVPGVPIHWEVKGRANIAIYKWVDQALADCRRGRVPTVMMKGDRRPWLLMLRAGDLPMLVRASMEAGVVSAQAETQ